MNVKNMLRENTEELLNNSNIKKVVLRANNHINPNIISNLKGTKALLLEDMTNTDEIYNNRKDWGELLLSAHDKPIGIEVTTWSSLVRNAVDLLKPQIKFVQYIFPDIEEFKSTFEVCVKNICEEMNYRLNSNCPKRLFKESEETDLIHSSIYMNNKNHLIPIITDENGIVWYMCAVYTGEIITMLEALLDTIYTLATEYTHFQEDKDKFPHHTMVITYINRDDLPTTSLEELNEINTEIIGVDNEIKELEITKDLIKVQSKLMEITTLVQQIYTDVNEIQRKYNFPTIDDILK